MFPETLETDALVLRRLSPDHVDVFELYDLFAEGSDDAADVFRYVPQEPFATPKDARDWLRDAAGEWKEGSHAKYGVYAEGDTLAGATALSPKWDRRSADLSVILAKPFWGRGYAGECAAVLAEVAFDRLDLELVALGYDEGNERSKRAIERFVDRLGGQYDGLIRNATRRGDEVADAHRYTVAREEYRDAVGDP